jgi:competence protein ComEA
MAMKGPWISLGLAALSAFCSFPVLAGPVNINTADAATLAAELTGVGPALAEEIVRDHTPEALTRVKGIGERIIEMNRENIRVRD